MGPVSEFEYQNMGSKLAITKLDNKNYFPWKFKMQMILSDLDLWGLIKNNVPAEKAIEKQYHTLVLAYKIKKRRRRH